MSETQTAVAEKTETATKKAVKTGNLILDIATEVESLSKTKALNRADKLAEEIETDYLELGGVLLKINDNSWYEGYANFDDFVFEKYGFQSRKARYLMSIYTHLVTKQIPWEKVQGLGWTKLKDLAEHLTPENVDEWVAKAKELTVLQLQAVLKAGQSEGEGEKTAKTTDDVVKMNFKLKTDQAEAVQQALAKAKGELHTEFDSVALANIALGYLGGNSGVSFNLDDVIKNTGLEPLLQRVAELHPEYDIEVKPHAQAEEASA